MPRALLHLHAPVPELPDLAPDELLRADLATKGLSESGCHLLDAHRTRLRNLGCVPLAAVRHGQLVWTAGSVIARQKPPSAGGFAFFVLEDRLARVQVVISPDRLWQVVGVG
ncbi:hypothetical protein DAETH_36390 (plasmid) [Deinococcus aetherius]|uniref:Uncharacterized protein n=1 Tax=Deinococcus aetherius TaxID=200252 RepID=A0ABN6RK15_9DEIO|nr:hypothetical protein [Deinococcus aetherius]BDP43670.1 hypothetical protein DAETH_36390 [Deinococcus aetherius]